MDLQVPKFLIQWMKTSTAKKTRGEKVAMTGFGDQKNRKRIGDRVGPRSELRHQTHDVPVASAGEVEGSAKA
jgi:hypothetical protein